MRTIRLLIDGYNVLFQSHLVGKGRGRGWLIQARERLLKLLATHIEPANLLRTSVVFDAAKFGETPSDFSFNDLIDVRFAKDHAEADDLLEVLIRQAPQPKLLTVISSDLRIRRCATARRAVSIDAETFLRQLPTGAANTWFGQRPSDSVSNSTGSPEDEPAEKELGTNDVDYWLREFDS